MNKRLPIEPDTIAPDGSDVRVLLSQLAPISSSAPLAMNLCKRLARSCRLGLVKLSRGKAGERQRFALEPVDFKAAEGRLSWLERRGRYKSLFGG